MCHAHGTSLSHLLDDRSLLIFLIIDHRLALVTFFVKKFKKKLIYILTPGLCISNDFDQSYINIKNNHENYSAVILIIYSLKYYVKQAQIYLTNDQLLIHH